ncbi:MAG: alpha-L-arabinofuranosidase [Chitinophagaceae bacterium]|nr:alpha-L-arabinofuranosidase [Chitinophagaceae bacterium]
MKKINTFLIATSLAAVALSPSCKKAGSPDPVIPIDTTVVINPPVEPTIANTIGFFLDDWQPKNFVKPSVVSASAPTTATYAVTIDPSAIITKIPRSFAGNNANLWMTQMVTEASLMTNITNLHPHIIRFPGGSISDIFFWNANTNVNPAGAPDTLIAANGTRSKAGFWYGKNPDSWTLSVDNYYNMLQQTGNKGIITINYGYARYGRGANPVADAAHMAADWVRYDNGRTRYWEIGNENFGDWEAGYRIDVSKNKDGQTEYLSGALYGQHVKVFIDSMRKAAQEIGQTIFIGAVMVEAASPSWATTTHRTWNSGLLTNVSNLPDFYVVHNYYTSFNTNSNAAEVLNTATVETKKMMDFVIAALPANGAAIKPIALDEWNIFATGSRQQVSHINGMHGIMVLGESLKYKIGLTARWDLANGWDNGNDHGMFSNGDEPGVSKWNPRPAFYHMYFFQKTLGDRLITTSNSYSQIYEVYSSSFTSGEVGSTIVNKSTNAITVKLNIKNFKPAKRFYWYTLSGSNDNGEFSRKVVVNGKGPDGEGGGPSDYHTLAANASDVGASGINISVPARSVVCVVVDNK